MIYLNLRSELLDVCCIVVPEHLLLGKLIAFGQGLLTFIDCRSRWANCPR